jgi:hypothetical protein
MSRIIGRGRYAAETYPERSTGGGGGPTGDPNAIGYFNPAGSALIDDPALTAAPTDPFGRPQIRDIRILGPAQGAVWRNGAWQVDGDASNVTGEGYVTYGPAENGLQDGSNGAFGRVKYNRFGIRYIIGGVDIGYAWRVDPTSMAFTDDAGAQTAEIVRATGTGTFNEVRTGGAAGARLLSGVGSPVGSVFGNKGDLYLATSGGANTLWVNENGGVGGWVAQTVRVSRGIVPLAPDNIPDDSASHLLSAGLVHTSATANVAVWITLIGTWTGVFTPSQIGDLSFRFTVNGVPAPSAAATPYITDAAGTAVAPSQAAFVLAGFKNLVGFGPNTYSASVRLGPLSPPGGLIFQATSLDIVVQDIP